MLIAPLTAPCPHLVPATHMRSMRHGVRVSQNGGRGLGVFVFCSHGCAEEGRSVAAAGRLVRTMPYKIVAGGQTGVDRAALDIAFEFGLEYGGWCPKGGWAEDLPQPPGLLSHYPKLQPTPLEKPEQRTEWNVRDSDATLILIRGSDVARSKGTQYTVAKANEHQRRYLILDLQDSDRQRNAMAWLEGLGIIHVLNIAGPRESEAPGIYEEARIFLCRLLLRAQ